MASFSGVPKVVRFYSVKSYSTERYSGWSMLGIIQYGYAGAIFIYSLKRMTSSGVCCNRGAAMSSQSCERLYVDQLLTRSITLSRKLAFREDWRAINQHVLFVARRLEGSVWSCSTRKPVTRTAPSCCLGRPRLSCCRWCWA